MKTTIRIARAELGNLFHSPIAWLLLAVFFIQVALAYLGKVENYVAKFETGENLRNLTYEFFADPQKAGIFIKTVLDNLYLYIPLITMGLVSREKSSGTFKLLYSSPVKLSWIVLGKYLAMLFFNACMIGVLVIVSVFASWHIDPLDWGMVGSGLFGIFLLLSAYAAIGLFLSCLSNYQVVAAIATFGVFALFKYVGSLWQDYDFVREITAYISISGRTETMISGLISTRDVLYYLFITAAFLLFAGFRLRAERVKERKIIYSLRYSVVAVVVVAVGYVTSLPGNIGYWDTTHTLRNTLSTDGQKELDLLDSALSITSYVNLLDPTYYKARPRDRKADEKRWERYKRFKPDIRLDYVYYYDSTMRSYVYHGKNKGLPLDALAERFSKANRTDLDRYLTPDEIQKRIDLYPENNRLVWQLKYQGKSTFLRTFNDMEFWPSETEIIAALRRLTITLPRVGFLQGQEERHIDRQGDRHYKLAAQEVNVRESLLNQGFDVEEVTLQTADDTIPEGLAALVIADPRAAFAPETLKKLQRYIAGGGNAWIAGEPGKQHILNPLLEMLGVRMVDGTIVQGNTEFGPDEVESIIKSPALDFGNSFVSGLFMAPISTPSAAALDYTKRGAFTVRELFRTDIKDTWMKTGRVVLDSADMVFDPSSGDVKQAFPTGLALTRQIDGREQRIVVTGDADFLSNAIIGKSYPRTLNSTFLKGFFSWFTDGQFPAEPFWPSSLDTEMTVRSDQISLLEWIMLGVIPGLIVLSGTVLLIRRKRK